VGSKADPISLRLLIAALLLASKNKPRELRRYKVRPVGEYDQYWRSFVATSPSQAKYKYWKEMDFYDSFSECFTCFEVRLEGGPLWPTSEAFRGNARYRGIPFAYCGMRVEVAGKLGVIVGHNSSANLDVLFDGWDHPSNCHPWWEVKYFDRAGGVIVEYTEADRGCAKAYREGVRHG
jgi:hypothetical protein